MNKMLTTQLNLSLIKLTHCLTITPFLKNQQVQIKVLVETMDNNWFKESISAKNKFVATVIALKRRILLKKQNFICNTQTTETYYQPF